MKVRQCALKSESSSLEILLRQLAHQDNVNCSDFGMDVDLK